MRSTFQNLLVCTISLIAALPVLAQHPDDVAAVRQKLLQQRQEVILGQDTDVAAKANRLLELGEWQAAEQVLQSAKPGVPVKLAKAKLAMLQNEFEQAEALVQEVLKESRAKRKFFKAFLL